MAKRSNRKSKPKSPRPDASSDGQAVVPPASLTPDGAARDVVASVVEGIAAVFEPSEPSR